jgi:hypothetical protein
VTVTFTDLGGRTQLTTHYAGSTEQMFRGTQSGWTDQYRVARHEQGELHRRRSLRERRVLGGGETAAHAGAPGDRLHGDEPNLPGGLVEHPCDLGLVRAPGVVDPQPCLSRREPAVDERARSARRQLRPHW